MSEPVIQPPCNTAEFPSWIPVTKGDPPKLPPGRFGILLFQGREKNFETGEIVTSRWLRPIYAEWPEQSEFANCTHYLILPELAEAPK